jgi:flagellar biosynthesis component FlhA
MLLGTSLQVPHGSSHCNQDNGGAVAPVAVVVMEYIFLVMMVLPMMVFILDLLFGMHLLIFIEMQVICV